MGSESDWSVMCDAANVLTDFGVAFEARVLSAHRTPDRMTDYARSARERGLQVIVAGAGGAAHLPGMIAASTTLPVIGVPIPTKHLQGLDSLLSIVQMPSGVPVATVAIGQAKNAALLAVAILASHDIELADQLTAFRVSEVGRVEAMDARVSDDAGA
jgi:5-(carboxyamino)imidazole ribonucleotide mutase